MIHVLFVLHCIWMLLLTKTCIRFWKNEDASNPTSITIFQYFTWNSIIQFHVNEKEEISDQTFLRVQNIYLWKVAYYCTNAPYKNTLERTAFAIPFVISLSTPTLIIRHSHFHFHVHQIFSNESHHVTSHIYSTKHFVYLPKLVLYDRYSCSQNYLFLDSLIIIS